MARKTLLSGFLAIASIGTVLTSCHDENVGPNSGKGEGGINIAVDLNTSVVSSRKESRATTVTVSDLALKISSTDGKYSHTWASLAEFDPENQFDVGDYVVEAYYGSIDNEGFDRPAYFGSTTVTVLENKTTPVSLTASLANSMVSIEYTDEFRDYMNSWSAELHSTGGAYLYYGPDETKPIYLRPGDVTLDVDVKKPNGVGATLRVATFTAQPRYHYHLVIGLEKGAGTTALTVTFDENLAQEDVEIDLSDEILNAPAPAITGNGIENDGEIVYLEGSTPTKSTLDIAARGGIAQVVLTTHSASLRSKGWPEEIQLVGADPKDLTYMNQLGFVQRGVVTNPEKFGVLDFTDVPRQLNTDVQTSNVFELRVVDKYGKVSEPFKFGMKMIELVLVLSNPSEPVMAGTSLEVDLSYNGLNFNDVILQAQNDRGIWDNLKVTSVTEKGDGVYRVALVIPASTSAVNLRASSAGKYSETLVVNRKGATDFTLTAPENDIWSTKATLILDSEIADASILAKYATVYVSTDGTTYSPVTVSSVNGNAVKVTGLNPGTSYYAKASITGLESQSCPVIRFATETEAGVPNGDFEDIAQTYNVSGMYQGGQWSISKGINYQTKASYQISEAAGWATTNAKTMSGTENTWFRQPSVFNTTLTYSSTVPSIKVINTGGGTETPDAYNGFSAHSGSNAMVVRNVAWDGAGSTPGTWLKTGIGSKEYYNHTVPNIANRSVGKMFLGSYSYSNGTEVYNQGVSFSSRPSALTGWYTYATDANDSDDTGVVVVEVLNGNTVIGSGTASLGASSAYKEFTVKVNYVANAPKATSVRVYVASSKYGSTSMAEETSKVAVTTFLSRYESYQHGATLVVDDFKFVY